MEYWEEILKRYKKDYGEELVEECGINYMVKVRPDRAKCTLDEIGYNIDRGSLPRKYLELVMFATCIAIGDVRGAKLHATGALKAGAKRVEVFDTLYASAAASMHKCSRFITNELKPILEQTK